MLGFLVSLSTMHNVIMLVSVKICTMFLKIGNKNQIVTAALITYIGASSIMSYLCRQETSEKWQKCESLAPSKIQLVTFLPLVHFDA